MSKQQMEKWRNRYGQAPAPAAAAAQAPAAEAAGSADAPTAPQPVSRRRRHIAEAMQYAEDTKDDLPPRDVERALEQARITEVERRARHAENETFVSGRLIALRDMMSRMDREGQRRRAPEPLHDEPKDPLGGGCRGRRTLGCAVRR